MLTAERATRKIEVTPMPGAIGALVECGDVKTLDDAAFEMVHRAFLDNLVLLIRGQRLIDPELLAFADGVRRVHVWFAVSFHF